MEEKLYLCSHCKKYKPVVCAAANMMKGYMEYNDLINFCEAIIKNNKLCYRK